MSDRYNNPDDAGVFEVESLNGDLCIDCDGTANYPSGAPCNSCNGTGRVPVGDGLPWTDETYKRPPSGGGEQA